MFGRIQWHVIPEPRITLQGAASWWIHCHDSRATCHIAGCSHLTKSMLWSCHIAGCKNSIWHIENRFSPYFIFWFLMQFRLRRAAAFVSSPIDLLYEYSSQPTDNSPARHAAQFNEYANVNVDKVDNQAKLTASKNTLSYGNTWHTTYVLGL